MANEEMVPQKWGELSNRIMVELGLPVVIFWGPGEEEDAGAVHRIAPGAEIAPRRPTGRWGAPSTLLPDGER